MACGAAPLAVLDILPAQSEAGFEAPAQGEVQWRGRFAIQRGQLQVDAGSLGGRVSVEIDMRTLDMGNEMVTPVVKGPLMFNVAQYPVARFEGLMLDLVDGLPRRAEGVLTLHGVSLPQRFVLQDVRCAPRPGDGREQCSAQVEGVFQRDAFGVNLGHLLGLDMSVRLKLRMVALMQ